MGVCTEAMTKGFDLRLSPDRKYIHVNLEQSLTLCVYQFAAWLISINKYLPTECDMKFSWDGRIRMNRPTIIFTVSVVCDGAKNSYKFTLPTWLIKGKETQENIDEYSVALR